MATILPASAAKVAKAEFGRFVGIIACGDAEGDCNGASQGFIQQGLSGEGDFTEPSSAQLAKGGNVVLGFLEGKPFSWQRYSVDFPGPRAKWVVLNELTVGEGNRAFLTLWKSSGDSLECMRVFPHYFPLALGEMSVHTQTPLPDGSMLLLLKGEGSDAGVNIQDWNILRLQTPDKAAQVDHRVNRSEIPVQEILNKINADETVEPVQDSSLMCEVARGKKAPSGGPLLRYIISRTHLLYTKAGPQESPGRKDTLLYDPWKSLRGKAH